MRHILIGLIAFGLGIWGIIAWWGEFGAALRGLVPILLVLGGLAAIGAGLKGHASETEPEKAKDTS